MLRSLLGTSSTLQHHSYIAAAQCRRRLHTKIPSQTAMTPRRAVGGLLHVQTKLRPSSNIPRNVAILGISHFHSTPRRQAAPFVPFLLGALKVGQLSPFPIASKYPYHCDELIRLQPHLK